jgi:hypothetical protein
MLQAVPEVKSLEVGRILEDNKKDYDYAAIMRFDNLEDKLNYGNSEVHRRWVKEHVGDSIANHLMLTIQPLSDADSAGRQGSNYAGAVP